MVLTKEFVMCWVHTQQTICVHTGFMHKIVQLNLDYEFSVDLLVYDDGSASVVICDC
jgi:hypothetical protein